MTRRKRYQQLEYQNNLGNLQIAIHTITKAAQLTNKSRTHLIIRRLIHNVVIIISWAILYAFKMFDSQSGFAIEGNNLSKLESAENLRLWKH